MQLDHLTDTQLQEYLEGNSCFHGKHLGLCGYCRERLEVFRAIYDALAIDDSAALPEDFTDKVLARIPVRNANQFELSNVWIIGIGCLLAAVVMILFADAAQVSDLYSKLSLPQFTIEMEKLGTLKSVFTRFSLPIFGGLIMASLAVLDRLIIKPLLKHTAK